MVYEDLKKIAAKWDEFGYQVGIEPDEVEVIRANSKQMNCFNEVIKYWLKGDKDKVTREKLAHAVEVAGNSNLARDIRKDPCLKFTFVYLKKKLKGMAHCRILGSQLGVDSSAIKNWDTVRCDVFYFMNEVVMKWFETESEEFKPSMKVLKEALDCINEVGLRQNLEEKYKG